MGREAVAALSTTCDAAEAASSVPSPDVGDGAVAGVALVFLWLWIAVVPATARAIDAVAVRHHHLLHHHISAAAKSSAVATVLLARCHSKEVIPQTFRARRSTASIVADTDNIVVAVVVVAAQD